MRNLAKYAVNVSGKCEYMYLHISTYASFEMPLYAGKYVICEFLRNVQYMLQYAIYNQASQVSTTAVGCQERFISEMTYYVSMSMSNVNLYSALSYETSNALNTLVLRK